MIYIMVVNKSVEMFWQIHDVCVGLIIHNVYPLVVAISSIWSLDNDQEREVATNFQVQKIPHREVPRDGSPY